MKRVTTIVLALSLSGAAAQAQLAAESFENHGFPGTQYNLTNATLSATFPRVTAFGGASEIDVIGPTGFAGATPIRGNWMLGLDVLPNNAAVDAFSIQLVVPVVAGSVYHMTMIGFQGSPGSVGTIEIGLSNSPTDFGAPLSSFTPNAAWGWTAFQMDFVAQSSGGYLTIRASGSSSSNYSYVLVDDILLTPTPGAAALLGFGGAAMGRRKRR